jgi:hypothetical protein
MSEEIEPSGLENKEEFSIKLTPEDEPFKDDQEMVEKLRLFDSDLSDKDFLGSGMERKPSPEAQRVVERLATAIIESGNTEQLNYLDWRKLLSKEFKNSVDIQPRILKRLVEELEAGNGLSAVYLKEGVDLSQDILGSPEAQEAAKNGLLKLLNEGKFQRGKIGQSAISFQEAFGPFDLKEFLPEIEQATEQGLIEEVSAGRVFESTAGIWGKGFPYLINKCIEAFFEKPTPAIVEAAKKGIVQVLTSMEGNYRNTAYLYRNKFVKFPEFSEFLTTEEFKAVLEDTINKTRKLDDRNGERVARSLELEFAEYIKPIK